MTGCRARSHGAQLHLGVDHGVSRRADTRPAAHAHGRAGRLIAYSGVWVIATRGRVLDVDFADPLGVGLALVSTLIWALYWLLNTRDRRSPLVAQWQNFSVGVPVLTLILLMGPEVEWVGATGLAAGIYVGLFEMGIAFVFWQLAMRTVSRTARISNLIFLSPPISLVLLFFIVGEPILPRRCWAGAHSRRTRSAATAEAPVEPADARS